MNKTVAVVVTYNRLDMLKCCLTSLMKQTVACDIMIVDNASIDGTEEYVRSIACDTVFYFNTGSNLGGAGGFNFGIRKAAEAEYSYIWLMDDDCLPYPDALEKLLEADKRVGGAKNYGFLSSVALWTDGRECKMNRQLIKKDFFKHVELMQYAMIAIDQATFVSLFLPLDTVQEFGLPYREYFIWGDDIEYTRRISMRGKKTGFLVGQSVVIHAMQQNNGSNIADDDISRLNRYRFSVRNECFTYSLQGFYGRLLYLYRCIRAFWQIITHAKDHKLLRLKILFYGMIDGLFFCPKVEYIQTEELNP